MYVQDLIHCRYHTISNGATAPALASLCYHINNAPMHLYSHLSLSQLKIFIQMNKSYFQLFKNYASIDKISVNN